MSQPTSSLQQQAQTALDQQEYNQAAFLYEQLVEQEPETVQHAWYLGLARLLSGMEAEAQFTWMMVLSAAAAEQVEAWTVELVQILQTAVNQQEAKENWQMAWAIRQHLREVAPADLKNLLHLVQLAVKLELFDGDYLESLQLTPLLQSQAFLELDQRFLFSTVLQALEFFYPDPRLIEFTEAALTQSLEPRLIIELCSHEAARNYNKNNSAFVDLVIYLSEICLRYDSNELNSLKLLSTSYEAAGRYDKAIDIARRYVEACQTPEDRAIGLGVLCIRLLKTGLGWEDLHRLFEQQKALTAQLATDYQYNPNRPLDIALLTSSSFYPYYISDNPVIHRPLQNQIAAILQTDLQLHAKTVFNAKRKSETPRIKTNRKLRIGYIARYMQQHPVGYIARWLMKYHDYEKFDIYTYHLHTQTISNFTDYWFVQPVTRSVKFEDPSWANIAKHIAENDEIDILVDLDSITYTEACNVMALKPAPVQVTWMGFDASGIPAVDYYIADPYVLPESAQDYYSETIWRLPSTYLAVDGFEVGVPTLRRDLLNIPADAVIYLSSQDGRKRHPEMIRLQLQILRELPNSYLLIKGLGDAASLKQAFEQIAESEGVAADRLRFLGRDMGEPTHRANLGIADVVLDTYPYNGATTTLETLWMGVPLVTRVGQQWAARNSYTMLMNVGVSEGIAWTDEEYVEWAVRLGKDAALRHDIQLRLLQSRQTAPLWDTRQFAREMENAYTQMWQKYIEK
ncbi:MAG: O-linked N-acetylglucosamine transferase, SPINDLY family protein [Pegethrix bostrychoides GSE-TBD4-15B]|jgi:predicted O-linked N-acetylglucosamine transferase (SPINDLY family)|uniref:O-linked N-acetylglucosamine transferase, SPINDLY family protein n=1 Tax=Pegethrix bostrychoides GSE-TBD4-15B TaxID=2839662 RepID=A0A951PAN6_9CYAN|nr:O-linked N-acetylglucosamine transferase, SPINDLY family protein [Pegethrix bostrychoides GSE-TBD4-15B]